MRDWVDWIWIIYTRDDLAIVTIHDAFDIPSRSSERCLLCSDNGRTILLDQQLGSVTAMVSREQNKGEKCRQDSRLSVVPPRCYRAGIRRRESL